MVDLLEKHKQTGDAGAAASGVRKDKGKTLSTSRNHLIMPRMAMWSRKGVLRAINVIPDYSLSAIPASLRLGKVYPY